MIFQDHRRVTCKRFRCQIRSRFNGLLEGFLELVSTVKSLK
jgi:hypothetical protein